jgi:hypothetical protein
MQYTTVKLQALGDCLCAASGGSHSRGCDDAGVYRDASVVIRNIELVSLLAMCWQSITSYLSVSATRAFVGVPVLPGSPGQ